MNACDRWFLRSVKRHLAKLRAFVLTIALLLWLAKVAAEGLAGLNYGNLLLLQSVMRGDALASRQSQQVLAELVATPVAASAHRSLANLALLEGRSQSALSHALQSVHLTPSDWWAYDLAGRAFWTLGKKESARAIWQEKDLLTPRLQRLSFLGWASFAQKDYQGGIAYFEQGLDLDPSWSAGYWAISGYYWDVQQVERARPYLAMASQLFPQGSPEQLFVTGRLNLLDGNYAAARDQFCAALKMRPQPWFFDGCLWVLWHEGDFDQGWQVIQETASLHSEWAIGAAQSWGDRLLAAGLPAKAVHFYRIACPDVKKDGPACVQLSEAMRMAPNGQ